MVLSFHGNGKDMNSQATLSRFTDSTINPHMIAVFPNGQPGSDDGELCWEGAPYCSNPASDKVFVTDLLNYMRNNYCVDNTRIYASGKSNGGGFVDVLACSPDHGSDFAAFAMDAAALYNEADGSGCTPARSPMPILELHALQWRNKPRCTIAKRNPPVPKVDGLQTNSQGSWDYTQYDCQGISSMVVGYNVTGQEHWWISTQTNADNNGDVAPIDASTLMMTFFNNNYKPS
ncbi:hypothetical protein LTR10_022347 [Elasticomyces elasticus]|uniref:feruloyl esterase n=1 Tax=Exophiala sideris TaxID=1016849 RepID=A0ABR0J4T3_9EURO|nr:hypothetical protein LTR10_022347 [Elasticomyces elasticus]KAK5026866.1 hypothetical protein LTS07_007164 [Exophiala sideris]KAK5033870.1 hypothetical protein LTR13_006469 [Exophiala sideris]KAK5055855.1 hypothetical protein LTR69_008231 [Exophiala sideris]KAK5180812.1 hypothetical protein LTR44_006631 [Eurotiomycetes sp. CCFEE 6388]